MSGSEPTSVRQADGRLFPDEIIERYIANALANDSLTPAGAVADLNHYFAQHGWKFVAVSDG